MPDRKIVFYALEDADPNQPFDLTAALTPVNNLEDNVWVVEEHGLLMAVIVDEIGDGGRPAALRFLRIRDDRPYVIGPERQPRLIDIEQDYRVTDFTYAMIWPDGYMAAISSRDAPNIKYLATYLRKTSQQKCQVTNLYAADVVQRLRRLRRRGLTRAEVKIHTADAVQLEHDQGLRNFKAFWEAGRGTEAVTIHIDLSVDRSRDKFLAPAIVDEVERLVSYGDLVDHLVVKGEDEDGIRHEINLKQQRIFSEVSYEQTETNQRMYARLESARRVVEDPDLGGRPLDDAARLG